MPESWELTMYRDRIVLLQGLLLRLGFRFDGPISQCRECGRIGDRGPIGTPEANTPIVDHAPGCALATALDGA